MVRVNVHAVVVWKGAVVLPYGEVSIVSQCKYLVLMWLAIVVVCSLLLPTLTVMCLLITHTDLCTSWFSLGEMIIYLVAS